MSKLIELLKEQLLTKIITVEYVDLQKYRQFFAFSLFFNKKDVIIAQIA
ncbi:hypothetical protein HMPREF9554_01321 [Treponema phagedenis F0421]|nr:hypothetical protein HMPREF9554_01321 [Treponema phagedenis F0421]